MITNNFNKELRGISDALRDLGYTDSTIGLRQRYWKEYCFFHGSLDIDEASMDEFLLKNYDIQSGNINVSKRQYEVRAALRNLLEYRRYGKIRNYHTPWFKDLPWVESFRAITEDFISHLRSQNSKPETIVNDLIIFRADGGNHFTHYGIYEGMFLIFDVSKDFQEGRLSCYLNDTGDSRPKFKVSDKPLDGYHHLGRLVASMKNYEV